MRGRARETGVSEVDGRAFSARLCFSLAPVSQLLRTRKGKGLRAVWVRDRVEG